MSKPAQAGDTKLCVASNAGFVLGRRIRINGHDGSPMEYGAIAGLGSIWLARPLAHAHPAGTIVDQMAPTHDPAASATKEYESSNIEMQPVVETEATPTPPTPPSNTTAVTLVPLAQAE